MRHHHLLQLHFTAERFQFARDVLNRFSRLRRSAQARSDVVTQMRHLPICVITAQCLLLEALQVRECLRREDSRRRRRRRRRCRYRCWRGLLGKCAR